MEHDLENYRTVLLRIPSYCASPIFLSGIGWHVEDSGHILVDKSTNANTVAIVIGHVLDYRFFVTPNGNYSTNDFGDFSTSKYLFVIGVPDDTPFASDFEKGLEVFNKIQGQVASTPKRVNFIANSGRSKVLRFTRNVFEKRITEIDPNGAEVVDEVTEHWPVKRTLRADLDKIKYMFQACPLPVYVGDRFIKPENVHEMLKGALVEVSFELRHYCIQKKHEDSFNALVQQVLILQPGKARPCNAFKRRNVFDGPVRPCPTLRNSNKENGTAENSDDVTNKSVGCSRIALRPFAENSQEATSTRPLLMPMPVVVSNAAQSIERGAAPSAAGSSSSSCLEGLPGQSVNNAGTTVPDNGLPPPVAEDSDHSDSDTLPSAGNEKVQSNESEGKEKQT